MAILNWKIVELVNNWVIKEEENKKNQRNYY